MNIKLSEKSQLDEKLPTFNDISDFEMFALAYVNEVELFLKLPDPVQAEGEEAPTGGKALCFRTGQILDFMLDAEDHFRKVKSIEVETGEEFIPLEALAGAMERVQRR